MTLDWPPATPQAPTSDRLASPRVERGQAPLINYDLTIVGGSVVGLTLACMLHQSGLRVAVIEAQPPEMGASRRQAYALSLVSARIFAGMGIWSDIEPYVTRFDGVRLSDADHPQVVEFTAQDLNTEAIYYAAEHSVLMTALQKHIQQADAVDYLCPARLNQVEYGDQAVTLQIDQDDAVRLVQTRLLVAADGARSRIRQQAGIDTDGWKYWQSCITVLLQPEQSHQNTAYERFWPSGPFAILPLPNNRCQIVWTAPHAEAESMMTLEPEQFMAALRQRYGDQMGHLTPLSDPLLFRVQLMQSQQYAKPRLALVGDAAHCCHPVGGQGLNMGIRDAAALAQVLLQAQRQGEDLGSLRVLQRYQRWRKLENYLILGFTDFLDRCFSNCWLPLVWLRRRGIWALKTIPVVRRLALRVMVGLFGRLPELAQRPTRHNL
ncbi:MAG: FAD-dependent hydroxylase [Thainema sp.]